MNRRFFLAAAGAAVATLVAGCGQPTNSKFIGYWQSGTGKHPTYTAIRQNGDSYIVTITEWRPLFGYETHELGATLSESNNMLNISQLVTLTYDEATDELVHGQAHLKRIAQAQYESVMNGIQADLERQKKSK